MMFLIVNCQEIKIYTVVSIIKIILMAVIKMCLGFFLLFIKTQLLLIDWIKLIELNLTDH